MALSRTQMYINSFVHRCTQIVSLQQKPDDSFIIMYPGVFFDKHLAIVNSSQDSNIWNWAFRSYSGKFLIKFQH